MMKTRTLALGCTMCMGALLACATAAAADATIKTLSLVRPVNSSTAAATLSLPSTGAGAAPVELAGWHHRLYGAYYAPYSYYRPYYGGYGGYAYRPYSYYAFRPYANGPYGFYGYRPYVYRSFYAPYWGAYYGAPLLYGAGYSGMYGLGYGGAYGVPYYSNYASAYPGCYLW